MKNPLMFVMAAVAALIITGCASSPKQSNAGHGNETDIVKPWIESRVDASKAFASKCTVGTVATAINAIALPLQVMQRNAYDKVDVAYANAKGRRIYSAVRNDVNNGASSEDILAKLSKEDKTAYDNYVKYVVNEDFGKRESALKAMMPKLAQAGVEVAALVIMAKKDPNFAKLAGLAMLTQVKNVNKDMAELKKILADTNKATELWKQLDEQDKLIQKEQKEIEAKASK